MPADFDWNITTEQSAQYLNWIAEQARNKLESDPLLSIAERSQRESYVRSIREEAKKRCDDLRELAESNGFKKIKWTELEKHALWAAKRQVLGITLQEIAKKDKVTVAAVSKAVRAFLAGIELPERKFRGAGRPRRN